MRGKIVCRRHYYYYYYQCCVAFTHRYQHKYRSGKNKRTTPPSSRFLLAFLNIFAALKMCVCVYVCFKNPMIPIE